MKVTYLCTLARSITDIQKTILHTVMSATPFSTIRLQYMYIPSGASECIPDERLLAQGESKIHRRQSEAQLQRLGWGEKPRDMIIFFQR